MPPTPRVPAPSVAASIQHEIARLAALPETRTAFAWLRAQEPQFADWQLEMARIPAPPFGEVARGAWLQERFTALGLKDVHVDEVGNVFGISQAAAKDHAKYVALSAHIDTVFPAGTPLNIR